MFLDISLHCFCCSSLHSKAMLTPILDRMGIVGLHVAPAGNEVHDHSLPLQFQLITDTNKTPVRSTTRILSTESSISRL
jgi:hypothetical protein